MTRPGIPRLGRSARMTFLMAAAVSIMWGHAAAQFHPFGVFSDERYHVRDGNTAVVSAVAAVGVTETGEARGIAALHYLNFERPARHLRMTATFQGAVATFDEQDNIVAVVLSGVASVTDVTRGAVEDAELQLVSDADGIRVFLAGNCWDLTFQTAPAGGPIAVEVPGLPDVTLALAAVRFGPNGELDTMALSAASLSTGDVLGGMDVRVEDGREPFIARGDVDRMRIEPEDEGVRIDLRGPSSVLSSAGECVSTSSAGVLLPIEDVFSISGRGTVQVARCGIRMTMSSEDPGVAWVGGIRFR